MNLLIDDCPESVEINGVAHQISSDHRTAILFKLAITDPELTEDEKVGVALNLYYEDIPEDIEQAVRAIIWFQTMGRSEEEAESRAYKTDDNASESKPQKETYSFNHDDEYVFSSFLTAYNIDLTQETLHWWKFMALFNTLPEDTIIKKIMGIRSTKITSSMSKEEKKRIKDLQKIYALPQNNLPLDEEGTVFGDALGDMF